MKPSWSRMDRQIYTKLLQSNCKELPSSSCPVPPPEKEWFMLECSKGTAKCTCPTSLTFPGSEEGFNQWNEVRSCEFLAVNKLNVIKHTHVSLRRWLCIFIFIALFNWVRKKRLRVDAKMIWLKQRPRKDFFPLCSFFFCPNNCLPYLPILGQQTQVDWHVKMFSLACNSYKPT